VEQFLDPDLAERRRRLAAAAAAWHVTLQHGRLCHAGSARRDVAVTLSDTVIDVCEAVDATITVSNESDGLPIRNLLRVSWAW
jgi:hypothetical protein